MEFEATNYLSKFDFSCKCPVGYSILLLNCWTDEICSRMKSSSKQPACDVVVHNELKAMYMMKAHEYRTKYEFYVSNRVLFNNFLKESILDELCGHLFDSDHSIEQCTEITKDICHREASKFQSIWLFSKESPIAYNIATLNKWLQDICLHM